MAKPRPVAGVDPARRVRPNARRILATRIDEVWSYSDDVTHPGRLRQLHDMRIGFKRLRYLIEIFGDAFRADLTPFLEEIRMMQDLLGDIHDRDVQVPMLQDHLERLATDDAERARDLLARTPPATRARPSSERDYRRFAAKWERSSTSARRPGIMALLERRTQERDELYARFLTEWRRFEDTDFRGRLESALGIRPDERPAPTRRSPRSGATGD